MFFDHKYDYLELSAELFKISRRWILDNSGTIQDAEDITQEAILVLYHKSNMKGFVLTVKPTTFLMGVVKCLWYKELRSKNKFGYLDSDITDVEDVYWDAIESANKGSTYFLALQKSMERLGKNCQKLIEMFYYERQSMDEIYMRLGYSGSDAAKTTKSRCMKKLQELSKEQMLTV